MTRGKLVNLGYVMKHTNLAGTVYACDMVRWLGIRLSFKDKYILVEKITELRGKIKK